MPHQTIVAYTLVDITENNVVRVRDANTKQYHQMQNLNVLIQTIGLRTQPYNISVELIKNASLRKYDFGNFPTYNANVWRLVFTVEPESLWQNADGPLGELFNDADGIAITSDLDNSVEFDINIFDTKRCKNLYFETGQPLDFRIF